MAITDMHTSTRVHTRSDRIDVAITKRYGTDGVIGEDGGAMLDHGQLPNVVGVGFEGRGMQTHDPPSLSSSDHPGGFGAFLQGRLGKILQQCGLAHALGGDEGAH